MISFTFWIFQKQYWLLILITFWIFQKQYSLIHIYDKFLISITFWIFQEQYSFTFIMINELMILITFWIFQEQCSAVEGTTKPKDQWAENQWHSRKTKDSVSQFFTMESNQIHHTSIALTSNSKRQCYKRLKAIHSTPSLWCYLVA